VAGDFSWLVVKPTPGNILRSDRKITSREHQSYGKLAYRPLEGQNLKFPMCPASFDGQRLQRSLARHNSKRSSVEVPFKQINWAESRYRKHLKYPFGT